MKECFLLCFLLLLLHTLGVAQNIHLEVEGGIKLGKSSTTNPEEGMIRWTGSDLVLWNGVKWISLLNGFAHEDEVQDIDGNSYPVIRIFDQEILRENLRTTRYANGDPIARVIDQSSWSTQRSGAWCWNYNEQEHDIPYGKFYNWYAATDTRGLCPAGWHVPTKEEWTQLITRLGGVNVAGAKMKETGFERWNDDNEGATNESMFTGVGGGYRQSDGIFKDFEVRGSWWSQTIDPTTHGFYVTIRSSEDSIDEQVSLNKKSGLSIRCFKD